MGRIPADKVGVQEKIYGRDVGIPWVRTIGSIRAQSAQRLAWHSHENVELIFLLSGATSYEFSGYAPVELGGGEFLLVPARTLHRGKQDVRMPSVLAGIVFEAFGGSWLRNSTFGKSELARFKKAFGSGEPRVGRMGRVLGPLAAELGKAVQELNCGADNGLGNARIRAMVCLALVEVVALLKNSEPRTATALVSAAEVYLQKQVSECVRMDELAAHLGLSRARMFALFKGEKGMSPNDYLQRYRVERTKSALRETEKSITELAFENGFGSSQYFSRVFRKYCGMSPQEYRRVTLGDG